MSEKKYELIDEFYTEFYDEATGKGPILRRIRALKDFGHVKAGDLGGFVEEEANLSHDGNCWIDEYGYAWGGARISGNIVLYGGIFGNLQISGGGYCYPQFKVDPRYIKNPNRPDPPQESPEAESRMATVV